MATRQDGLLAVARNAIWRRRNYMVRRNTMQSDGHVATYPYKLLTAPPCGSDATPQIGVSVELVARLRG
eukprot:11207473-Lingulodinium_polyedra.AAC.1